MRSIHFPGLSTAAIAGTFGTGTLLKLTENWVVLCVSFYLKIGYIFSGNALKNLARMGESLATN